MSPIGGGADTVGEDWLDPSTQWSPYRVRRSSYVIATTQDVPAQRRPPPPPPRPSPDVGGGQAAIIFDQSPTYDDARRRRASDRDLDLPALLTLPLASPGGEPWTPTSAESLSSPTPTPRHWDSAAALADDRRQPEMMEISSLDCATTSGGGSVGNHVDYSGRNALLMISPTVAASDAITPVESTDIDPGWCNACRPADSVAAKTPEAEVTEDKMATFSPSAYRGRGVARI